MKGNEDMESIHETIKGIKAKFRLFMNGVVAQSLRDKGLGYKLIFGIEYPRIKEIASEYQPDHDLAQALWKEDIRECKIMAGLLQPVDTFCPEIADIWIEGMRYPEEAEYAVMNLFRRLPYASEAVFRWMADEREYFQLCGYLLMARLLMKGMKLNKRAEAEFFDQAFTAIEGGTPRVRRAASSALCKFALQSRTQAKRLARQLDALRKCPNEEIRSVAEEIKNEIEYSF